MVQLTVPYAMPDVSATSLHSVQWAAGDGWRHACYPQACTAVCAGQQPMPLRSMKLGVWIGAAMPFRSTASPTRTTSFILPYPGQIVFVSASCAGKNRCKGASQLHRHVHMQGHRTGLDDSCKTKPVRAARFGQWHTLWPLCRPLSQITCAVQELYVTPYRQLSMQEARQECWTQARAVALPCRLVRKQGSVRSCAQAPTPIGQSISHRQCPLQL